MVAAEPVEKNDRRAGADALEHGLVDELGGLRTAIARAKLLAGLDVDEDARIVGYPGSSLIELLRPRPSSQPAAASLPEAVGALLGRSVAELLSHAQQSVTGTTALLLGDYLYAHGLVRIAEVGSVEAVADLAELISLCAQLRADSAPGDGAAWAASAALLGAGELGEARLALRDRGDAGPLAALAEAHAGGALDQALAAHDRRLR